MPTTSGAELLSTLSQPHWLLPLFLAIWLLGSLGMARMAGWHRLAKDFSAGADMPSGDRLRFVSGSLGSPHWPMRYRHCLCVVISEAGLYIRPMHPFRFGSHALLVPWHRFESVTEKQLLSTRVVVLQVAGHWPVLSLPGPVGQLAKQAHLAAVPSA